MDNWNHIFGYMMEKSHDHDGVLYISSRCRGNVKS